MGFYSNYIDALSRNTISDGITDTDSIVSPLIGNRGVYQEIGNQHITTLFPNRGEIGSVLNSTPQVERALARTASILSNVPTHALQGAQHNNERAYHVITQKIAGDTSNKVSSALHSLSVATLHNLMFYPDDQLIDRQMGRANMIKNLAFGKGRLDGITSLNDNIKRYTTNPPFDNNNEKSLMYLNQFTGLMDMYGSATGFDFWYINNDPQGQYAERNMRTRFRPAITQISSLLGINDNSIFDIAMRTHASALTRYERIHMSDGGGSIERQGDINSFGRGPNGLNAHIAVINNMSLRSMIDATYNQTLFNATGDATPVSATTRPRVQNTPPLTPRSVDATPTATPTSAQPTFDPLSILLNNSPPVHTDLSSINTISPIQIASTDDLLRIMSSGSYSSTFVDAYNATSTPASIDHPNYINRNIIEVIPDAAFHSLEETFPTGGIETTPENAGNLSSTSRSIAALQKVRERLNVSLGFDRDAKFYEKVGNNYMPANSFDVRDIDPTNMNENTRKRLTLGGALVGVNPDGTQKWMVDDVGQSTINMDVISNTSLNAFRRRNIDISSTSMPNIDFNHRNWQLVNTDMHIDEALHNGYVVPIKDNKAIFLPSFTALDFTFGLELEAANMYMDPSSLNNKVRQHFGYDLNNMGFNGSLTDSYEPSLPNGKEYVTPIMSGVRAFKAAYILGETLKLEGATEGGHMSNRVGRNDPSGIHVNVGTISKINVPSAIKFAADYLRLTEDVFKKITNPDKRYRYSARNDSWSVDFAIDRNSLTPNARNNAQNARQFWSQSISNVRMAREGKTEYEFLRETGSFYHSLEGMCPSYSSNTHLEAMSNEHRLAKYKTVGLHKLQLQGLMEFRSGMYVPGGIDTVAQLVMSSKLASDIYQGASNGNTGNIAVTDKLVPPTNGWGQRSKNSFNEIIDSVFGINAEKDQKYVWDFYNKCKNG